MLTEFTAERIACEAIADYKNVSLNQFLKNKKLGFLTKRYGKQFVVDVMSNIGGFISLNRVRIDAESGTVTSIEFLMGEFELS